jgi:hypothetical protein
VAAIVSRGFSCSALKLALGRRPVPLEDLSTPLGRHLNAALVFRSVEDFVDSLADFRNAARLSPLNSHRPDGWLCVAAV